MPSLALRPFVAALALALGACQSVQVTEEEARPPSCGSSPTTSTSPRRASRFTPAERRKALETYPKIGANTLFAFLLDHEGNIRRVDLLRTSERRVYREELLEAARTMRFNPDPREDLYRCVYFPARWNVNRSFEWL